LAVALFDCPLVCGLTPSVCAEETEPAAPRSCCRHCDRQLPVDSPQAPSRPSPNDEYAVGQCICYGAVVEQAASQPLGIDLNFWAPIVSTAPAMAPSERLLMTLQAVLPSDDGMNVGRNMRCRFMSYLC
ncbi:MAG TPA: hypothetical protein VF175_11100, partial [Lacipirellula sp.]